MGVSVRQADAVLSRSRALSVVTHVRERGLARKREGAVGSFYEDQLRSTLQYISLLVSTRPSSNYLPLQHLITFHT